VVNWDDTGGRECIVEYDVSRVGDYGGSISFTDNKTAWLWLIAIDTTER
jgi:hypothetical protein